MGLVLAYHQVLPAKEACKSTRLHQVRLGGTPLRKMVDCRASGGLELQDLHNKTMAGLGGRRQQDILAPTLLAVGRFKPEPS